MNAKPYSTAEKLLSRLRVDIQAARLMNTRDTTLSDSAPGNARHMTRRQHQLRLRALARIPLTDKQIAFRNAQAAEIEQGRAQHRAELARKNEARAQRRLNAAAMVLEGNPVALDILGTLATNNGLSLAS